jgi:hypothetical protein
MDNAFTGRAFPGFTTAQLVAKIEAGSTDPRMIAEVSRRKAVAAGDVSKMTPAERLRARGPI